VFIGIKFSIGSQEVAVYIIFICICSIDINGAIKVDIETLDSIFTEMIKLTK